MTLDHVRSVLALCLNRVILGSTSDKRFHCRSQKSDVNQLNFHINWIVVDGCTKHTEIEEAEKTQHMNIFSIYPVDNRCVIVTLCYKLEQLKSKSMPK